MSRNPRSTTPCRPPPLQPAGPRRPGTAESAAGAAAAVAAAPRGRGASKPAAKSSIPKRGPPPAPPKRVDYKRPQITKAMAQRMKHTQKVQEELERREREKACALQSRARPAKRSAIPVSGHDRARPADPCGRERRPAAGRPTSKCPARPASGGEPVPEHTINLARSMNADIVQAEPLQRGLIDNLIIPPGAIDTEKTTIVSIPQPASDVFGAGLPSSTMLPAECGASGNNSRSIQAISDSLDEQDASEAALVNSKLQELQNARRDFVLAVANVGNNAVNLLDESQPDFMDLTPIGEITSSDMLRLDPQSPYLMPCCDPDDPYLQPEYGRHHPVVESAREYLRGARQRCPPATRDDGTMYLDDDAPAHCPQFTAIPRRPPARYYPDPNEIDRLERFFDLENYPPEPQCQSPCRPAPPAGKQCLPEDLWEIGDPWYRETEEPDLIEWKSC